MNAVERYEQEIADTQRQANAASGWQRWRLKRRVKRLQSELRCVQDQQQFLPWLMR